MWGNQSSHSKDKRDRGNLPHGNADPIRGAFPAFAHVHGPALTHTYERTDGHGNSDADGNTETHGDTAIYDNADIHCKGDGSVFTDGYCKTDRTAFARYPHRVRESDADKDGGRHSRGTFVHDKNHPCVYIPWEQPELRDPGPGGRGKGH